MPSVAVKVEVKTGGRMGTQHFDPEWLHQRISDLQNKNKPRSYEADKLIRQLNEEGIDILGCQLNRQTVVVWIMCHSGAALLDIQKLHESNQLTEVLVGLANIRSSEITQSIAINVDSSQFQKAVGKFAKSYSPKSYKQNNLIIE